VLRLEGLVAEKRITRVETTRYLVIDFHSDSISVYGKPPPKDEFSAKCKSKSVPKKLMSNVTASLKRSKSDERGGIKNQLTCENLAHISREARLPCSSWDPKFTVSASVDWKIRDVENDETLFYLVLPADFKKKDADAEVFSMERVGKQISYHPSRGGDWKMGIIKEGAAASGRDSGGGFSLVNSNKSSNDSTDDNSVSSSLGSKKRRFNGKFKRGSHVEQEVVYMFRVLLDGNEKFIWLQAAAELGRLSDECSVKLVSTTGAENVAKKIFVLPMVGGGTGRSKLTALRYAEWARLIDQKKNVSQFHFDVHDIGHVNEAQTGDANDLEDNNKYNSTRLVKVVPTYAYRNRRMTEKDLYYEMTTTSEKWEDFRGETVGDREDERIGSLHAEVLACHGLPKLDKLSSTDAVCYFVCGPYGFTTDVIDGFMSPVWPSKSRRACIFPIFQAYQKLFVGVFDDDGATQHDDFAGRVVVDIARLRPNSVYDVFLPLRMYQNTFVRKSRGVIHLRLRVEWDNERKALLSYLKLPTKTKELGNAVTLNCADHKAFRNAVLTVQGKDVPGRYKALVQKGLQREMKLYKLSIEASIKGTILDIVLYMNPSISLCIFIAWMHCVYSNSMAYVPVYVVAGILAFLVRNYYKYGVNEEFNFGFAPITITEMIRVLLYGGPNTKYIKPIKVARKNVSPKSTNGNKDELDVSDDDIIDHSLFDNASGFDFGADHMEFPFSEGDRYSAKTLKEACVDASALFQEDDDDNERSASSGAFSSLRRKAKVNTIHLPKANREDDDEDDEDEFALMVKTSVRQPNGSSHEATKPQTIVQNNGLDGGEKNRRPNIDALTSATPDKVWKRVKDTRGLPEQDASVFVKSRKTLKEELIHNKNLLHKMSKRMFDDRLFIINEGDPGPPADEVALHQAIGTNKYKNPMVSMIAEYVAPALEMLKVGLSAWRSVFNLFTWRDPFLTSLFFFGVSLLLCVLLVFPWRLFFFVVGFGAVGPQNWFLRVSGKLSKKKEPKEDPTKKSEKKSKKNKGATKDSSGQSNNFQFHNHLTTDAGVDKRRKKSDKSTHSVHRAVIPHSPLLSRRFYDWPPNPSVSKVDIYSD